jgi:hypothetical protein
MAVSAAKATSVRNVISEDRQASLHQGPRQRHSVGRPFDGQHRHDRRQGGNG